MISEREIESIAQLADITIPKEDLDEFTEQFNHILEYFDILDEVPSGEEGEADLNNIFREDEVRPSLTQDEALSNAEESEDGYIQAPRVM